MAQTQRIHHALLAANVLGLVVAVDEDIVEIVRSQAP